VQINTDLLFSMTNTAKTPFEINNIDDIKRHFNKKSYHPKIEVFSDFVLLCAATRI